MKLPIAVLCCAFVIAVGVAAAAPTTCDQTCSVIKRVLADRAANFADLKGALKEKEDPDDKDEWNSNLTPPGLQACVIMFALDAPKGTNEYNCYVRDAPQAQAQTEFAGLVSAVRAVAPAWKWFRDNDPRFPQAAGSISLFAGPTRGKYFAGIELTNRGATYLLTLKITSKPHTTSLRLGPYSQ